MSWEDFIVTSHPPQRGPKTPVKDSSVDSVDAVQTQISHGNDSSVCIVDIVLKEEKKKSSLSLESSLQTLTPRETSTIHTKPDNQPAFHSTQISLPKKTLTELTEPIEPVASTDQHPTTPLQVGWSVVYRDRAGQLRGGCDEPEAGIVTACLWTGATWIVTVRNGGQIPLGRITAVRNGNITWTVQGHGHDGEGRREG